MRIVESIKDVRDTVKEWKTEGLKLDLFLQWDIYMKDMKV